MPVELSSKAVTGKQTKGTSKQNPEAKLIIETDTPASKQPEVERTSTPAPVAGKKISALDKIRKQYQGSGSAGNGAANEALSLERLQEAWRAYIVLLKEARNPAAQPFELALLRIRDENCFEAVTANNIEQKFIEQERNKLFHFLQQHLHNRLLQFNVIVEEKLQDRPQIEVSLTAKEQFQKMSEQYPLVKELKERLRLDLDY